MTQPQIRTTEDLRKFMAQVSGDEVTDDNLIWFYCIKQADTMSDYSLKDMAYLFLEGIPKATIESVQEFIDSFFDGLEEEEAHEQNRLLLAAVCCFYGEYELAGDN